MDEVHGRLGGDGGGAGMGRGGEGDEGREPPALDSLRRYELVEQDNAVYREKKTGCDLVCNFAVRTVTQGQARYLSGRTMPLHDVCVVRPGGAPEFWTIAGSLFEPENWIRASGEKAVIADPKKFKCYVHRRVDVDGIKVDGSAPDVVYAVGIFRGTDGKFHLYDGVEFPNGHEECRYHGIRFVRNGDKAIFAKTAALRNDLAVKAVLVHMLGAPLKEALGGFYPHCQLTGDKETGKSTMLAEVCSRLGIKMVDGPVELATMYRAKKLLANSTIPIVVDEVGRLTRENVKRVTDILNSAYGILPTSHGSRGREYALMTPLVMIGQDCPIRDEALLSKVLVYKVDSKGKNPQALQDLRSCGDPFPTGEWLEFAAQYANDHDLLAECRKKDALLRSRLPTEVVAENAEVDRCTFNYATQLVVADALQAYGVDADIADLVLASLIDHLHGLLEEGSTVAEAFLRDLMARLGAGDHAARSSCAIDSGGIYIHVENALKALRGKGYTYEVSDPRTIARLLRKKGIGEDKPDRHYFRGIRLRTIFVKHATLTALGMHVERNARPA